YKIHVGTWDQPNSTIEAFEALPGSTTYKQFIKVMNMALSCDVAPCSASPGAQQGYNNLPFTPYMTGLDGSIGPSTTAHMWIDELVVSTQPIAVPESSGQAVPMPPSNVAVKRSELPPFPVREGGRGPRLLLFRPRIAHARGLWRISTFPRPT